QAASSDNRATVLSVKGLVFNLGYGLMSLGFSALLAKAGSDAQGQNLIMALQWQWPLIAVILAVLIMWGAWVLRHPPAKVNKV
ncbi:MAG TPA: hypothetical protein PKC70_05825, partial [Cellvibrionaceae bacterium]|nr:hypothetical protein [Cellvibrionaceae bacterium]